MTENRNVTARDPSLKRYFKYMLTNRKISVQFTSNRIKEIIETDLGIKFDSYDCLYARASTEAFAYYMQSWPEWRKAVRSTYSEELYERLKSFLREKLISLKEKEQEILAKDYIIHLNDAKTDTSWKPGLVKRTKLPHTLKVVIPANILTTQEISFRKHGENDLLFEFNDPITSSTVFSRKDLLNHPFVTVDFKIPGLIHIQRSTPFQIENYIQHVDDSSCRSSPFIISVENAPAKSKIYDFNLMETFFKQLHNVLTDYSTKISDTRISEILAASEIFLKDVDNTNLRNNTICESASVTYNIGGSVFYTDSEISGQPEDKDNMFEFIYRDNVLVHRKVITPIVTYSLKFCSILQQDITDDGFKYFYFTKEEDKVFESVFIHYVNASIKYKCTLCDTNFDLEPLKHHLTTKHRLHPMLTCIKCNKMYETSILLQNKWSHNCL